MPNSSAAAASSPASLSMPIHDGLENPERIWAVVALMLAVVMATLDSAIANTALPNIALDIHATPAASVWIVNAYQLAMIATLLPFAALGEVMSYRRVYLFGITLFTVASLVCALAESLPLLVFGRVLQGVGASAVMGINTALLRYIYPSRLLGRGLGLNAMAVAISFAVGPPIASVILSLGPWPWLFAINVPMGLLALACGLRTLPRTEMAKHGFDPVMALLTAATFGLLMLGLGEAAHQAGFGIVGAEIGAAFVFGFLLLRRQAGHPAPMLPVDLFRFPAFSLSALTAVFTFGSQSLAFVSLPFYFEEILHRSAVETGFLMTPWPVVVAIMAPIAGRLSDRYPPGILGSIGTALLALGLVSLAMLPPHPDVWDICWRMAICGGGFGFFQAPNLRAIMSSAPATRSGSASGVIGMARLFGQTSGAALVALLFLMFGMHGSAYSLLAGAMFAAAAAVVSVMRLRVSANASK
ncbi:MAG: multidrug transporter [Herbaspirillum sp.]|jgi:DHA2 family multidrug resistance protein-like MFS transporter|nr:multidrug transporter [Herbaspirillum sp.]